MCSFNKSILVLFFLILGLGWQCGGGDGKDGNGQDSFIFPENSDQFSDQISDDQTTLYDGVDVDLAEATSETENGDEANLTDLEPPLFDLNGEWYYKTLTFSGCNAIITQIGNLIFFAKPCPSLDGAKGTISGNKIELQETDGYKSYTGQIISEVYIKGTWINKWGTEENWWMNKQY